MVQEREESVTGVKKIVEELTEKQSAIQPKSSPEPAVVPTKTHVPSQVNTLISTSLCHCVSSEKKKCQQSAESTLSYFGTVVQN